MGAYEPDLKDPRTLLLRTEVSAPVQLDVVAPPGKAKLRASFLPVGPTACMRCHVMYNGAPVAPRLPLAERYEFAGPCGFGPQMSPARVASWESAYLAKLGDAPIVR